MIIIIEGADGGGKTTLAKQIAKQTKSKYIHMSFPKDEEEMAKMYGEYIQMVKMHKHCVLDRSWYSEMVYGPVMRNGSVITHEQMYALERHIADTGGGMIIHCVTQRAAMWQNCLDRGEDYVLSKDTFDKIYDGFLDVMNAVPHYLPVVTYRCPSLACYG